MMEPQSYQGIGWLIVSLFALAGGINQLSALVMRHKAKPPVGELEQSSRALAERMQQVERRQETDEERRRAIHRDLDAIGRDVSALQTGSELMNQRIVQIDGKVDRLLERSSK